MFQIPSQVSQNVEILINQIVSNAIQNGVVTKAEASDVFNIVRHRANLSKINEDAYQIYVQCNADGSNGNEKVTAYLRNVINYVHLNEVRPRYMANNSSNMVPLNLSFSGQTSISSNAVCTGDLPDGPIAPQRQLSAAIFSPDPLPAPVQQVSPVTFGGSMSVANKAEVLDTTEQKGSFRSYFNFGEGTSKRIFVEIEISTPKGSIHELAQCGLNKANCVFHIRPGVAMVHGFIAHRIGSTKKEELLKTKTQLEKVCGESVAISKVIEKLLALLPKLPSIQSNAFQAVIRHTVNRSLGLNLIEPNKVEGIALDTYDEIMQLLQPASSSYQEYVTAAGEVSITVVLRNLLVYLRQIQVASADEFSYLSATITGQDTFSQDDSLLLLPEDVLVVTGDAVALLGIPIGQLASITKTEWYLLPDRTDNLSPLLQAVNKAHRRDFHGYQLLVAPKKSLQITGYVGLDGLGRARFASGPDVLN